MPDTPGIGGLLVSFAPMLLLIGLFWWIGRRASAQLGPGRGLGMPGTIGRSRALALVGTEMGTTMAPATDSIMGSPPLAKAGVGVDHE